MTTMQNLERGYQSALSACPAAAAAAAVPADARIRAAAMAVHPQAGTVLPFQGITLPIAGRVVADVPTTTFVQLQPHPGDTARRPPA
jgi:hypothetical protein